MKAMPNKHPPWSFAKAKQLLQIISQKQGAATITQAEYEQLQQLAAYLLSPDGPLAQQSKSQDLLEILPLLMPEQAYDKVYACLIVRGPVPFHIVRQVRCCCLLAQCLAGVLRLPWVVAQSLRDALLPGDQEERAMALVAGTIVMPAHLLGALAALLPEQAELRQQQQQQQQPHRQSKGQLLPDQQAELDNSLNTLGQSLLHVWQLGCHACRVFVSEAAAAGDISAAVLVHCLAAKHHYCYVACYAQLSLRCWPAGEPAAHSLVASSSSSPSSSRSDNVRYGKQVLHIIEPVTTASALPAALATALTLAGCIDALQQQTVGEGRQVQQQPLIQATQAQYEKCLQFAQADMQLAAQSVLQLQLLQLACRSKLLFDGKEATPQRFSQVRKLTPSNLQQQQQQQQQQAEVPGRLGVYLELFAHHDQLLSHYACKEADIAALEQQHLAAVPHIRHISSLSTEEQAAAMLDTVQTAVMLLQWHWQGQQQQQQGGSSAKSEPDAAARQVEFAVQVCLPAVKLLVECLLLLPSADMASSCLQAITLIMQQAGAALKQAADEGISCEETHRPPNSMLQSTLLNLAPAVFDIAQQAGSVKHRRRLLRLWADAAVALLDAAAGFEPVAGFLVLQPYAAATMLEAAVRLHKQHSSSKAAAPPSNAAAAAAASAAPGKGGRKTLIAWSLSASESALNSSLGILPSRLATALALQEQMQLAALQVHFDPDMHAAAFASAADAAAQAVLAGARQQRQQVQLRLLSLLGSCVKAMAGQWQQMSWKWVAAGSCSAAKLSCQVAAVEDDVQKAQKAYMQTTIKHFLDIWRKQHGQLPPQAILEEPLHQALQHPYGLQLVHRAAAKDGLLTAMQMAQQLLEHAGNAVNMPDGVSVHSIQLAAFIAGRLSNAGSAEDSSSISSCSSKHGSGSNSAAAASSSCSSGLSGAQGEVRVASLSVMARALRLYGLVLEAALCNACLYKSSTAEARAAGAAQLAEQLALAQAGRLLAPLPQVVQHQLDKNNWQYLSSQKGAAAVIGALLCEVSTEVQTVEDCLYQFPKQLDELQGLLQLPIPVVQQLQQQTSNLTALTDQALQLWVDVDERGNSSCSDSDSASVSRHGSAEDPEAVQLAAIQRSRWVLNAEGRFGETLGAAMQRWAEAVAAHLPSRRCCGNPCCVVLREMSEWKLVNGKACCCGGCSTVDQAVRYCGKDCQVSHWPQHKPLCERRQQQQQQQQPGQL